MSITLSDDELIEIGKRLPPPGEDYDKVVRALVDTSNIGEMLHILDIVEPAGPLGWLSGTRPLLGPLRELALYIELYRSQKVDRAFDDLSRKISVRLVR